MDFILDLTLNIWIQHNRCCVCWTQEEINLSCLEVSWENDLPRVARACLFETAKRCFVAFVIFWCNIGDLKLGLGQRMTHSNR